MVRTEGDATCSQFCHENHPLTIYRQDSARLSSSRKKIMLTVILQDFCYTCMDLTCT